MVLKPNENLKRVYTAVESPESGETTRIRRLGSSVTPQQST